MATSLDAVNSASARGGAEVRFDGDGSAGGTTEDPSPVPLLPRDRGGIRGSSLSLGRGVPVVPVSIETRGAGGGWMPGGRCTPTERQTMSEGDVQAGLSRLKKECCLPCAEAQTSQQAHTAEEHISSLGKVIRCQNSLVH